MSLAFVPDSTVYYISFLMITLHMVLISRVVLLVIGEFFIYTFALIFYVVVVFNPFFISR